MFSCYFPSLHTPQMNVNVVKATVFHTNEQHKVLRNICIVAKLISNSAFLNFIWSHNENTFNVTDNTHCMRPEVGHHNVTSVTFYQTWGNLTVSWLLQFGCVSPSTYTRVLSLCPASQMSQERTWCYKNLCIPLWCSQQLWGKATNTTS